MNVQALATSLERATRGRVATDVALSAFTTYRLGGPAAVMFEPVDLDDLLTFARIAADVGVPVLPLGRGSNVVVSDRGFHGVVVRLSGGLSWISGAHGETTVQAGAGTSLPMLANWAARRGLAGAEFLVAIPGSVGGAVRMNAGAHGVEMSDHLRSVQVVSLERPDVETRQAESLDLAYRHSNLDTGEIVATATLELVPDDEAAIRSRMEDYRRHRAETQPGALQNAGSVFKNPPDDAAGRLVEAAGLKGLRVGGAAVSTLHANFFVADEGAAAQDVFDLVHEVRARVQSAFGVTLEPEVRFVGSFDVGRDDEQGTNAAFGAPGATR